MIVVTGAAGFIGSHMVRKLNSHNFNHIIAVDKFQNEEKNQNLHGCSCTLVDRDAFCSWLDKRYEEIEFIFHLGARTNTLETDEELLKKLNTDYSKAIWKRCCDYQIPLIYASSAATYGNGELGFDDDENELNRLTPLNAYAQSKHEFDLWAIQQEQRPFYWAGLKFFNVYGPENELHKGRMASMVCQAYEQILKTGKLKLFKSYHPDFGNGDQKRDFISVQDVTDIMYWLMHHRKNSGIYNVGTGKARSFIEMGRAVFKALEKPEHFEYIEMPQNIRDKYQYYTEAKIEKLRDIGYSEHFR